VPHEGPGERLGVDLTLLEALDARPEIAVGQAAEPEDGQSSPA